MLTPIQIRGQMAGVSLIELMIALAILGVISAIAVPLVTDYVATSRNAVLTSNIQTIGLFEDNYKLENRAFVEGQYDPANPNAAKGLKALLGWEPRDSSATIVYVAACQTDTADVNDPQCTRTSGYIVTATDSATGTSVCVEFAGGNCP